MNKVAKTISTSLILLTLFIGPFWLGSYYEAWRWPVLYTSATLIALTPILSLSSKSSKKTIRQPSKWIAVVATLTLITIGLFMWHNAWGTFSTQTFNRGLFIAWDITPVEHQPYYDLPGSADKTEAWDRLSYIIPCLLLIISTRHLISKRLIKLSTLCAGIFWIGTAIALLGLLQRFTEADAIFWSDKLIDKDHPLFFATFRSPGIATSYLNICLAIGLSHLLAVSRELLKQSKPKPTQPILISIGLTILFAGSISAGSKAGAIFAILTLLLWIMLNLKSIIQFGRNAPSLLPSGSPHERNIILSAALIAFILATLSFGNTVTTRWKSAEKSNFDTLQQRQTANAIQIEMIQSPQWSKVAGFGPGSFYPLFHYFKKDSDLTSTWVYAHNDHLQTLVEWGWLGTGCFATLIAGGCLIALKSSLTKKTPFRASHQLYFKGITLAMLICLLHATVDFPFQIESIAITFAILLGAAWAAPTLRQRGKGKREHSPQRELRHVEEP